MLSVARMFPYNRGTTISRTESTPGAMYGATSWVLNKQTLSIIITWENIHLRRMCGLRRQPEEEWAQYVRRHTRHVRKHFHESGNTSLMYETSKKQHLLINRILVRTDVMILHQLGLAIWPHTVPTAPAAR